MAFTVAIMQPYFLPYAGYFRLIAQADRFVVYDCVQFPRRGWVHRNKLVDRQGAERWLTLPLAPAPQETAIRDLAFAEGATAEMGERLRPFDLNTARAGSIAAILARLVDLGPTPVDYIVGLMGAVCARLDLPWEVVTSSSLDIDPALRGQDRILEIARRLGAERYLNAPGGRDLYDSQAFAAAGIELAFLDPFEGRGGSILQRLLHEDAAAVRREIAPG